MEKNLIKPHHEGGSIHSPTQPLSCPFNNQTIFDQHCQRCELYPPTGQCEYLIVTLADSMLEPIIPKARESKRFIDKWVRICGLQLWKWKKGKTRLKSKWHIDTNATYCHKLKQPACRCLMHGGKVLVHCNDGMSRAPALVVAELFFSEEYWLMNLAIGDCLSNGNLLHGL